MKHIISFSFLLLILFASFIQAQTPNAAPKRLEPLEADSLAKLTDNYLLKADLYASAWLHNNAISSLEASGMQDAETLWRLARSHVDIGENLTGDEALALFEQALDEAQRAVDLDSANALAQQTLATACGRVALYKGVFKSIRLVKRVHAAALLAVASGDSVPIAYYVLGRTHKKLLTRPSIIRSAIGLGWASSDSVAYYFSKALEISKGNMIQCWVEYGDFLIHKKKNKTGGRKMLETAVNLPLRDQQDLKAKKEARFMLEEFKK